MRAEALDPVLLRTFVAVADLGSFTAAAAAGGYTQSAVSRQVAALEDVCGVELFARGAHATPLGKVAGYNAAADLLGLPPRDFTPGPYVTCLDLGGAGGIFTRGWDRRVMASGADGKEIKVRINQAIHPPVDDAEKILAAADRVHIELPFFPRDDEETVPAA